MSLAEALEARKARLLALKRRKAGEVNESVEVRVFDSDMLTTG
jgi:hypothetical protein